jgi:hypothetical protein
MSILGDIAANVVQGIVQKQVDGFVTKYGLTAAQGTELTEGIMVALQIGGEMYEDGQKPAAG